jgi:hypothetical protein
MCYREFDTDDVISDPREIVAEEDPCYQVEQVDLRPPSKVSCDL